MINFLVALALCYVLIKIPFWVLSSIKGRGSSLIGGLIRGVIAYKTFGLLRGGGGGSGGKKATTAVPVDPYAKARTDSRGQYAIPFEGLKRGKPPKPPYQKYAPKQTTTPRSRRGPDRQMMLPLDGEWPENKPSIQADGQYRLAMPVQRKSPPPPPEPPSPPPKQARSRQMRFPASGDWPENRPRLGSNGQYRLPITARRQAPPPPPPVPESRPAGRSRQMSFPASGQWPEDRPRLGSNGQYRLPITARRQAPPTPPAQPDPASEPPSRPRRRRAVQPPLPLSPPPRRPRPGSRSRKPRSPGGPE